MSKKIFLPIIVFLSFFLFQNSVNAESSPSWQSNDLKFYNLGSMSDEEKTTVLGNEYIYYTRAKTYAINSCGTDSYYIYRNTNGGGFNVACFNQTDYKGASITVSSLSKYQVDTGYFGIQATVYIKNSKKVYMFNESYNGTTSSRSQFHYMEMGSYTNTQLSNMQAGFKFMFESNVPINFIYDNQHDNYLTSLGISSTTYRVYEYVLIDNKEYPVGTMFIGNDGSYQGNMEITFDVTKIDKSATYAEGEYIIGKTIQATISIRDFNKYAYQYSYDEKEWYSFKKDEWVLDPVRQEFKFTENGVLHVRVINKETNEVEKSGSFVVDGISHFAKDDVIYHSYIKIPLSDLYDSENGFWKNKSFIFMSYNADKIKPTRLEYYFELRPKDNVDDNKKIPLMVYFNKDIVDIREYSKKIASSPTTDPDGYGGGFTLGAGQGGGGGGGGRFDEDDNFIGCTNFPLVYNDELITTKHYATITISLNSCANISGKTPNDFSTDSIYVFYNGRYYDDVIDAVEDNLNSGSKLLGPFLNLINKKLPIVYQIGEIINSFKYDKSQLKKPSLMIDFTKVGLNFKYEFFSDDFLNAYDKYRDILYFFIYLSVGFIVVPKVIGYVKGYFGGGNE